ncbi:MAG: cysteine desulfurase [Coriobacteriales bacterium]|jgi:cysteine desulfurase|nr:cysteine desulfurase [Coriobacteriales bacterium]
MPQLIYLDNAATTKPYGKVVAAVSEAMEQTWGNPSSRHALGRDARMLVEESRSIVAASLRVDQSEIYFTSGGTESNNLALHGAAWAIAAGASQPLYLLTTTLEHASVTKPVRNLKRQGWRIDYLEAEGGQLAEQQLTAAMAAQPALVSAMLVQNELGYRMDLESVVARRNELAPEALVHTDAVQAYGKLEFFPRQLGVDLASISAHKIGGPKGVGALYVRSGVKMYTTAHGGGQERWLRSGTEAVPLIAGFAAAVRITFAQRIKAEQRARQLWEQLVGGLKERFADVLINSRDDGSPYLVNFTLPNTNNRQVLDALSNRGIFISTASACENNAENVAAGTWRPKRQQVLQSAGVPLKYSFSTYRVSFSTQTRPDEITALLDALEAIIANKDCR